MPEGPEVKAATDKLNNLLKNKCIKNIEVFKKYENYKNGLELIKGRKINEVKCKGKFIYIKIDNLYLGNHLGLTGNWRETEGNHTVIKLYYDDSIIYFDDVRMFGKIWVLTQPELDFKLAQLGPDPLINLTEDEFINIVKNKNKIIANLLIDQNIISGIGNYLRADILYYAGIHPKTKSRDISLESLKKLYNAIIYICNKSYLEGDLYKFLVYGQKLNPLGNKVEIIKINGRSVYY